MAVVAKGLEGIVAAETRIGDVRGQEGVLLYCGYDINELAGKASYRGSRPPPVSQSPAKPGASWTS